MLILPDLIPNAEPSPVILALPIFQVPFPAAYKPDDWELITPPSKALIIGTSSLFLTKPWMVIPKSADSILPPKSTITPYAPDSLSWNTLMSYVPLRVTSFSMIRFEANLSSFVTLP